MKNKKIIAFLPIFFAVIGFLYLQFILPKNTSSSISKIPSTPSETVNNFYEWYSAYEGNPLADRAYKTKPEISSKLMNEINEFVEAGPGFDPFICAQDKPADFYFGDPKIENNTAVIQMTQRYSTQNKQVPITLEKIDNTWQMVKIDCSVSAPKGSTNPLETSIIYFSNSKKAGSNTDCGLVYGVQRFIDPNVSVYEASLNQLFQGPTEAEKNQGFSSFFSNKTKNILKSVKVSGTTAYVNLTDIRTIIPNASSSCGSAQFLSSVEETLKHDRKITAVRYAIEGSPQDFYDWIQIGCDQKTNNCDPKPFK
jgi:spore germination protein GerM